MRGRAEVRWVGLALVGGACIYGDKIEVGGDCFHRHGPDEVGGACIRGWGQSEVGQGLLSMGVAGIRWASLSRRGRSEVGEALTRPCRTLSVELNFQDPG